MDITLITPVINLVLSIFIISLLQKRGPDLFVQYIKNHIFGEYFSFNTMVFIASKYLEGIPWYLSYPVTHGVGTYLNSLKLQCQSIKTASYLEI
jgi:hypothetical protein